jgi:hypothetical protein
MTQAHRTNMNDDSFLFKGIFFHDYKNIYCLLANHEDLQHNAIIRSLVKQGISYVRGNYAEGTFVGSARRLTQDELRLLGQNKLDISSMDTKLMKAKTTS